MPVKLVLGRFQMVNKEIPMEMLKKITPIGMIILLLGTVGRMDFDDHVQMEKYKCERGGSVWVVEQNGNQYCK